ncbi:MAG: endopeptidase La [Deltaproteobacteria bacterium]|nr:endopeptidase La [Deltaproteobacteria bacterium]
MLFPTSMAPVSAGPEATTAITQALDKASETIGVVPMTDPDAEEITVATLATTGTLGRVVRALKTPSGEVALVTQGMGRFRIVELEQTKPYVRAKVVEVTEADADPTKTRALMLSAKKIAREVIDAAGDIPREVVDLIDSIAEPGRLADLLAANLDVPVAEKIPLLEELDVGERLEALLALLRHRLEVVEISNRIDSQVKTELSKAQREHLLRQQLKAISKELGDLEDEGGEEGEGEGDALDQLKKRLDEAHLPPEAEKTAKRELKRLRGIPQQSAEYSVSRTYLEWIAELPWDRASADHLDLAQVRKVLEERHFGLEKVKKRIIEFLAVRKLKSDPKSPILCLVGPPGVGKTSLAQSVAQAMGRKLHRVSLGGVRDEAEIRGHRRTYVGALPGRVVQGLKKVGVNNPVFVLDEIDKLASDFRGDPSSALLEVLDPEQNHAFSDHYLELTFDLSKVLFIATANELGAIPPALRDRMEVIEIPGYTHQEKLNIARRHLVPKVLEAHGLAAAAVELPAETIERLIGAYTREAGVRNLERQISGVVRGVAVKIAEQGPLELRIEPGDLEAYLGPIKFENELAERTEIPGVAVGLAWTPVGGDILFIEATRMAGKGRLTLTGQLGEVMKESAQAAQSYLRSHTVELGIPDAVWEKEDVHVHLPAGATPKDGPSAGVTLVTALASLLSGIKVRSDVAMTGEITLRGNVLPVGGIKEKVLAAARAGITEVILPARNEKDLWDVPDEVKTKLRFTFVHRIDEVLDHALEKPISRVLPPLVPGFLPGGAIPRA